MNVDVPLITKEGALDEMSGHEFSVMSVNVTLVRVREVELGSAWMSGSESVTVLVALWDVILIERRVRE